MNEDEQAALAREVISDVASRWIDTPESFVLRDGDEISFHFTLPTKNGSSSISVNPLNQIIETITFFLTKSKNEIGEFEIDSIRRSSIHRLEVMLSLATYFYGDSFKYLANLAEMVILYDLCNHFGTLHVWNRRFKDVKSKFREWPESLIKPKTIRQQPSLVPVKIVALVRKDFTETRKRPSRNRVASLLDVTPRALDKFAEGQGYKTFNKWLDALFDSDYFLRQQMDT
ncbi:MAG: hypothetical protein M3362_24680 [Acidobacteriota bacterium]|nr:hypothetical protein [Acidobacteriota bacterium]